MKLRNLLFSVRWILLFSLGALPVLAQPLPVIQVSEYPPPEYVGTCPYAQGEDSIGTYILCADDKWTTWTGFVFWSTGGQAPDSIGIWLRADDSTFVDFMTEGPLPGDNVLAREIRGPLTWNEYVIPWGHTSPFVEMQIFALSAAAPGPSPIPNTLDKKVYYGQCFAVARPLASVRTQIPATRKAIRYFDVLSREVPARPGAEKINDSTYFIP